MEQVERAETPIDRFNPAPHRPSFASPERDGPDAEWMSGGSHFVP
ncbi:hypothetical protein [Asaia prunellae]|nr:hypothetical protein [Asaia prunellae]